MSECKRCVVRKPCDGKALSCCEIISDSRIKVEEKGMSAVLLNDDRRTYLRIKVDDCLVRGDGKRADWLIWLPRTGQAIIELKGRHVEDAVKQVSATADYLAANGMREGKLAGLVVCRQSPAATTQTQLASAAFRQKRGFKLTFKSKAMVCAFEDLL